MNLEIELGNGSNGRPVIVDLASLPHLLVGGAMGQGKTDLLHSILSGLAEWNSPGEVRFVVFDGTAIEFVSYEGAPHLLKLFSGGGEEAISGMVWLNGEMDRRVNLFFDVGVRHIGAYNERFDTMPRIVVIVDALERIVEEDGGECFLRSLERVAALGRSAGVHLLISSSEVGREALSPFLKRCLPGRVAFKTVTADDSKAILGVAGAEDLFGRGDALLMGRCGEVVRLWTSCVRG